MKQNDFTVSETIRTPEKEIDVNALLKKCDQLEQTVADRDEEISDLRQQLALLKKVVYGQKSEKTEYIAESMEQTNLFNEAECEENRREREKEQAVVVAAHTRKTKRTHAELAANLPVEEVVHEIPANERTCNQCGTEMIPAGREFIRDELVYVPARLFVRKHYAEVLKCPVCGTDESYDAQQPDVAKMILCKAAVPAAMIPHSFASPELLAHIAYEKYGNGMPLNRLEKDFAAHDVIISRATMANWIIYAAEEWLNPLWKRMKQRLLQQSVIHADETVVQVLREPGRKAKTDSRMWVYCAGELGCQSNILFEYQPTRSGDHASGFLGSYSGYLVCDGYDGYNKVTQVTRCGCWAHLRRKFVEALPSDKAALAKSMAAIGVEYCNRLFRMEESAVKMEPDARLKYRQEQEKPVLDAFFAWLSAVTPSSGTKLAKAVAYGLSEKKYLLNFLGSPLVPISNNRAENSIRPFVVGRKQWLFSSSVKGAKASAVFYSITATACANGINVERYFTHLFRCLSQQKTPDLDSLLPLSDEMISQFHI